MLGTVPRHSIRYHLLSSTISFREDSEYLVGLKEKILWSSEEFNETVDSEDPAQVHIDPALKRAGVYRRFIWRLLSLGMVRLSLDSECEYVIFCAWEKWNATCDCGCQKHQPTL